jgi:DNA-binding NtrC family response regulator
MRILVVEDDLVTRLAVKEQLENPGTEVPVAGSPYVVTAVGGRAEAEAALDQHAFDYAFIDLKLGYDRHAGQELLQTIVRNHPSTVCIMMTSNSADQAVETCLRNGAAEYIIKPFEHRIVHDIMRKARVVHRLWQSHRALRLHAGKGAVEPIRLESKSPAFQKVIESAKRLKGKQNLAVFISGESGVGKEVMARFLWTLEEDCTRVFMPVHTGALPKDLVESELFGFKKGAFSGATENKVGKFEAADGGDIFLDEVATMPHETQIKLLRVLQEKEVVPLGSGSAQPKKVNVRVISATNESLPDLVKEKRFREDLYFRLKMVTLEIPPLRERREDLADLVALFLRKATMSHKRLSPDAWELCRTYQWPGNVRELENALTVAAELAEGDDITAACIQPHLETSGGSLEVPAAVQNGNGGPFGLSDEQIQGKFSSLTVGFEQALVKHAIEKAGTSLGAARFLGVTRGKLNHKRRSWGWSEVD